MSHVIQETVFTDLFEVLFVTTRGSSRRRNMADHIINPVLFLTFYTKGCCGLLDTLYFCRSLPTLNKVNLISIQFVVYIKCDRALLT